LAFASERVGAVGFGDEEHYFGEKVFETLHVWGFKLEWFVSDNVDKFFNTWNTAMNKQQILNLVIFTFI